MKRRVMLTAWQVADKFNSFAEALSYAWSVIKLQVQLLIGTVSFSYKKVDGSIRKAIGTLDVKYDRKGGTSSKGVFVYYDLDAQGFRSAKLENLIF